MRIQFFVYVGVNLLLDIPRYHGQWTDDYIKQGNRRLVGHYDSGKVYGRTRRGGPPGSLRLVLPSKEVT